MGFIVDVNIFIKFKVFHLNLWIKM